MERVDVLIAGGGIIGSALAWALAGRGSADCRRPDLGGLYASSELNAGGALHLVPVNIATRAATLRSS
jgi:glycine/D-amino acid oxidase-like deaminating enzyme